MEGFAHGHCSARADARTSWNYALRYRNRSAAGPQNKPKLPFALPGSLLVTPAWGLSQSLLRPTRHQTLYSIFHIVIKVNRTEGCTLYVPRYLNETVLIRGHPWTIPRYGPHTGPGFMPSESGPSAWTTRLHRTSWSIEGQSPLPCPRALNTSTTTR